ncbi:MAG: hypothetical protein H0Z38_06090 [Firmicutes bacterium]|nr:hypothetical protein [Bacillota bacterium]
MSKKSNRLVQVTCRAGVPATLAWKGGRQVERITEILDSWREIGAWWSGEEERQVYLVVTASQKSYELCHNLAIDTWYLARIFD